MNDAVHFAAQLPAGAHSVRSAAYFAVYHPPMSWLPVGMLGFVNAFLFKRTRRLLPCVLCHMTYNAVVVLIK